MQQVLITGGAGFIGSHLADEMIGRACNLPVITLRSFNAYGPGSPYDIELTRGGPARARPARLMRSSAEATP